MVTFRAVTAHLSRMQKPGNGLFVMASGETVNG